MTWVWLVVSFLAFRWFIYQLKGILWCSFVQKVAQSPVSPPQARIHRIQYISKEEQEKIVGRSFGEDMYTYLSVDENNSLYYYVKLWNKDNGKVWWLGSRVPTSYFVVSWIGKLLGLKGM